MPKDYPRSDRISQQIKKEIADILSIEIKLSIKNFDDLKVNDKLEAYEHVQVARKL